MRLILFSLPLLFLLAGCTQLEEKIPQMQCHGLDDFEFVSITARENAGELQFNFRNNLDETLLFYSVQFGNGFDSLEDFSGVEEDTPIVAPPLGGFSVSTKGTINTAQPGLIMVAYVAEGSPVYNIDEAECTASET